LPAVAVDVQAGQAKQITKQQAAKAVVPLAKPELVRHLQALVAAAEPKLLAVMVVHHGLAANQVLPEPSAQVVMVAFSPLLLAVEVEVATTAVAAVAVTTAVLAQMAVAAAAAALASTQQVELVHKVSKLAMAKLLLHTRPVQQL
jgi:hypothetical protein